MTPFQVYRLYLAVKLHFSSEKYDIFESRGAVKCTEAGFNKSRGRGRFDALAKYTLKEPRDAVQFFVANAVYDTNIFEHEESLSAWTRWNRNKQMMTQLVLDDVSTIVSNVQELEEAFRGDFPLVVKLLNRNELNIESIAVLDRFIHFTRWDNWTHNLIQPKLHVKINKLQKFLKVNDKLIMEALNEHSLA